MALQKCPRCELNYILDGDKLCTVCRKEVRGESERDDIAELCSECGENPVVPGSELCINCLKEIQHRLSDSGSDDVIAPEEATLGIDSVSTMDEIELDLDNDMGGEPFDGEEAFDDEEEDEDEEDDKKENGHSKSDDKEDDDDDLLDQ